MQPSEIAQILYGTSALLGALFFLGLAIVLVRQYRD
jgi:hypothetical protein